MAKISYKTPCPSPLQNHQAYNHLFFLAGISRESEMAKFAVVAVVLVALFAIALASPFRTMVTTTVEEDNLEQQWGSQQRCRQQVQQKYRQLQPCRRYLRQSMPFEMDMDMDMKQQLRQCCEQLRRIQPHECTCIAVRQMAREQMEQFGCGEGEEEQGQGCQQEREVRQMMQKARMLPRECNMGRECRMESPY
jgi:hypothetical protein